MTLSPEVINNIILSDYRSQLETEVKSLFDRIDLDALSEMISVYGTHRLASIMNERQKSGQFDLAKLIEDYKGGVLL